jgi:rare lipoprotein A
MLALAVTAVIGYMPAVARAQTSQSAPAPAASGGALTGAVGETQTGLAAYTSHRLHGRRTASGERFNNGALTTAHQTLPFGTRVRVTNVKNKKSVVLRVNDRGPTQPNRILDVSRAAGERLGFIRAGLTEVKLEVVSVPKGRPSRKKAA